MLQVTQNEEIDPWVLVARLKQELRALHEKLRQGCSWILVVPALRMERAMVADLAVLILLSDQALTPFCNLVKS